MRERKKNKDDLSVVVQISSLIYELSDFGFVNSIGGLGLIYFSYNQGQESFEKAAGMEDCGDDEHTEGPK